MSSENLTPREKKVLSFLKDFFNDYGHMPNYKDVMEHMALKSKNSSAQFLKQLKEKGFIDFLPGQFAETAEISNFNPFTTQLRIEGNVSAGLLTEAVEDLEYLEVPTSALPNGESLFGLKVRGDSMIDEHIINDDTILVRRTNRIKNGMVGVIKVDGEATLKKIFRTPNGIKLVPANREYKTIHLKNSQRWELLGEVFQVIRNFN